jgi:hypothetical protein
VGVNDVVAFAIESVPEIASRPEVVSAISTTIERENVELNAHGAQALPELFHKTPVPGLGRGRVHVRDEEDAHESAQGGWTSAV